MDQKGLKKLLKQFPIQKFDSAIFFAFWCFSLLKILHLFCLKWGKQKPEMLPLLLENRSKLLQMEDISEQDYSSQSGLRDLHTEELLRNNCTVIMQIRHSQPKCRDLHNWGKKSLQLCLSNLIASLHFNCMSHCNKMTPIILSPVT